MSSTLFYIAGAYVLVVALLYVLQERLIFQPEKLGADFRYRYDIPFREMFIDVAPGVRINGLHFYAKDPLGLVLYFHGNTRSIKGWAKYARDFYRYRYDVVMVDYRGFGKSTGKRGEQAMFQDMQVVYATLQSEFTEDRIIIYGRSLGSGFAAKLASDNAPRYLILDAPFYSFTKAVKRFLPFLPLKVVLRFQLQTHKWIKNVSCHTYILHGTKDWLIPIRQSEQLRLLNPDRITLIRIEGGGHNNLPSFPEYHSFIRDILAP